MYTLGIPDSQYRRCTQVLGPEAANPIDYEAHKQDDGFYMFSFPDIDEYDFKDIVLLLKNNGITTIGADETLTERNIMKLTNLLKEQPSPDENNLVDILKNTLESWEKPEYRGGIEGCEKSDHYYEDIKDIVEDYEEDLGGDAIAMGADDARDFSMQEEDVDEGTCGYGKNGKIGNKPAGPDMLQERFQKLAGIKPLYEQGFDAGLKAAGGFNDEEFDDITSRDVGSPFPGTDSSGPSKASELIEKLREDYKSMSNEELDAFSKEMTEHFLDNTAAQAAAKVYFGKRNL